MICKYAAGEFTDAAVASVPNAEYALKIAELERKVGQPIMDVDRLKKAARPGPAAHDGSGSVVRDPKPARSQIPDHEARAARPTSKRRGTNESPCNTWSFRAMATGA
jgi:hypothetical protein